MAKVKAKVLITFRDKVTEERHVKGTVIDVASQTRFDEINSKGDFLEAVEEVKEPKAKDSKTVNKD